MNFSMTQCLQKYIVSKANCYVNWFQQTKYPSCKTSEELNKVREAWSFLNEASFDKIKEKTGCGRKCSAMRYEVVEENNFDITWNSTKWISEFYIYTYITGFYQMYVLFTHTSIFISWSSFRNEYYTFDVNDLFGSVGGYLGKRRMLSTNLV